MGVRIVESTRDFGVMNANSRFYPMRYDAERREKEFFNHRKNLENFMDLILISFLWQIN